MFNLVVSVEPLDTWLSFQSWFLFNTKRSRCEQDSTLRGKLPLDFKSNALTTRPSQLVQSSWVRYVQARRFNVNLLKHRFLSIVVFFWHKKVSLRAGIEHAREDPIWIRGQRLYHSAITSDAIKSSALCSTSSFQWNHLTHGFLSKAGSLKHKKISLRARFEPAREDPIRIRDHRPNHSAIAAGAIRLSALCWTSSFQCEPLDAWLPFQSWISFFNSKKGLAASRIRTCAGRSHWISSPTPQPLGHRSWCN